MRLVGALRYAAADRLVEDRNHAALGVRLARVAFAIDRVLFTLEDAQLRLDVAHLALQVAQPLAVVGAQLLVVVLEGVDLVIELRLPLLQRPHTVVEPLSFGIEGTLRIEEVIDPL